MPNKIENLKSQFILMLVNFCSVLKKSKVRRFAYKMTSADVTIRTNR